MQAQGCRLQCRPGQRAPAEAAAAPRQELPNPDPRWPAGANAGQTHVRTQPEKRNRWVLANPRGAGGRASTIDSGQYERTVVRFSLGAVLGKLRTINLIML